MDGAWVLLFHKSLLRTVWPVTLATFWPLVGLRPFLAPLRDVWAHTQVQDPRWRCAVGWPLLFVATLALRHSLVHLVSRLVPLAARLLLWVLVLRLHAVPAHPVLRVLQQDWQSSFWRGLLAVLTVTRLLGRAKLPSKALLRVRLALVRLPWLEQVVRLLVLAARACPLSPSQPLGPHLALVASELTLPLVLPVLARVDVTRAVLAALDPVPQLRLLPQPHETSLTGFSLVWWLVLVWRPLAHLVLEVATAYCEPLARLWHCWLVVLVALVVAKLPLHLLVVQCATLLLLVLAKLLLLLPAHARA